jgi:DNA-binding CsgD family transcriptional regulator
MNEFPHPSQLRLVPPTERREADLDDPPQDEDEIALTEERKGWQMKALKPRHRQIASLLAQGAKRQEIAAAMGVTPEYVTMLQQQPLMKDYIREMCEVVGVRFEALFGQAVEVISDVMKNGNDSNRLKAARLQMEGTGRVGSRDRRPSGDSGAESRLEKLAERLLYLQSGKRPPGVYSENGEAITEAEFSEPPRGKES